MEITGSDNVLVDSSIWIEFFIGNEPVRSTVNELIDKRLICCTGLIVGELIQGAKSKKEIDILNDFVHVFEFLPENSKYWIQAGYLSFELRRKGKTIGLADCFLAVLASKYHVSIYTNDDNFLLMENEANIRLFKL